MNTRRRKKNEEHLEKTLACTKGTEREDKGKMKDAYTKGSEGEDKGKVKDARHDAVRKDKKKGEASGRQRERGGGGGPWQK